MKQPTIMIHPDDFTKSAWEELCNAAEFLGCIDSDPKPRTRTTARQLEQAMAAVEEKAQKVESGYYGASDDDGEGDGVDIEEWADDLRAAGEVLQRYANTLANSARLDAEFQRITGRSSL